MLEHLHLFSTNQIRTNYEQSQDYTEPYASLVTEDDSVHYNVPYTPVFGDYLLSDLKTIVKQSEITQEQKPDAVGICIGQNPYTGKNIFVNVDGLTNSQTVRFYTSKNLPEGVFTTYASSEQTGTINNKKVNDEVLLNNTAKIVGKITALRDISLTSGDMIYQVNDFAGLHNTIEWAKQAKAGNGTIDQYPALQRTFGYSGIISFDDVDDNYNGWFLASSGYLATISPALNSDAVSSANVAALNASLQNLGKSFGASYYYGSSLASRNSNYSYIITLNNATFDYSTVSSYTRLFALIER